MDRLWIRHLTEIDSLRQGVGLQAYGQQDPLVTYKREAFDMFDQLVAALRRDVVAAALHAQATPIEQAAQPPANGAAARRGGRAARVNLPPASPARSAADAVGARNVRESGGQSGGQASGAGGAATATASRPKVGRNQPCPCGSGKKYKRCHGQAA